MQAITIPLQYVGDQQIGNPEDCFKIISDEYASRYLEQLGVVPTASNKQAVMRNMPLRDCEMQASWASRTSAIADSITILPPQRKRKNGEQAFNSNEGFSKREWYGQAENLNVAPPAVSVRASNYNRDEFEVVSDEKQAVTWQEELRMHDMRLSEGADPKLTKEVELTRLQRGGADVNGTQLDEMLEERRRNREQELGSLKQKFILPFCCEQPAKDNSKVLVSWHAEKFQGELNLEVPEVLRQEVLQPISMTV